MKVTLLFGKLKIMLILNCVRNNLFIIFLHSFSGAILMLAFAFTSTVEGKNCCFFLNAGSSATQVVVNSQDQPCAPRETIDYTLCHELGV